MHYLEFFFFKTIKYELVNKFKYNNIKDIPKLKKIVLNFGCKTAEVKQLASSLLAIELITNQNGTFTRTKNSNILFKIRKGNPTGCKVTLQKFQAFNFLEKFLVEIFPALKIFKGFKITKKIKKSFFSYELHETFSFSELESNYYLFNNLPKLNITLITNSKNKKELIYILKSFQLPFFRY